jgi:cell division septal protein FtsQ
MSEIKELEAQISQLSKRFEEQMRLTRSLIALCTTVTVGVMFFVFTLTLEHLPNFVIMKYMSNLDAIVKEWQQAERSIGK